MKRSYITILRSLVCLALVASAAWAGGKEPIDSPGNGITANCDLNGYKSEVQTINPPAPIPDAGAAPGTITVGPIVFPDDGLLIADVVIDISAAHTWVGDLIATVKYDENCDGAIDASTNVLCRQRGTNATAPGPCGTGTGFGCSGDLVSTATLLFDDTAAAPVAEGVCPTTIAAGCYKPALGNALATFRNRHKGGCWFLTISDNAGGDTGSIFSWSVHIRNQPPIGVTASSWGSVKTLYN